LLVCKSLCVDCRLSFSVRRGQSAAADRPPAALPLHIHNPPCPSVSAILPCALRLFSVHRRSVLCALRVPWRGLTLRGLAKVPPRAPLSPSPPLLTPPRIHVLSDSCPPPDTNRIPLRPEGGLKRKIFRLLGIGSHRKPAPSSSTKDIQSSSSSPPSHEKQRKSRILSLGNPNRDAERLQHVRESKIRQPLDTGDAGSINFSTTSLQNPERPPGGGDRAGGGGGGGGAGSPLVGESPVPPDSGTGDSNSPLPTDSTVGEHDLGQYDSATTSNTSTHSPLDTATSNKPPSTLSDNTAATSYTHPNRPVSATPIMLPPHQTPASPVAPSTSSLYPRLTDDASVLTLASSSKRVRRRNSFDTNASMLAIAPGSRRDSEESEQETDSNEPSISGARRSVGSVLSSKLEGKARSVTTGHSVGVGEEGEDEGDEANR
jgi:hypothetical protein